MFLVEVLDDLLPGDEEVLLGEGEDEDEDEERLELEEEEEEGRLELEEEETEPIWQPLAKCFVE